MPFETDWATDARGPFAFLGHWAEAVSLSVNAQLAGSGGRFIAPAECDPRARTFQPLNPTVELAPPTLIAPARFTDRVGVSVIDKQGGPIAAAVLFVTPDHKADSDGALAFAVRAAGLMSGGASVVIVDVAPGPASWATHLHSLTGVYPIARRPRGSDAPVLVVCPGVQDGAEQFAVWYHLVAAGKPLPTVHFPVRGTVRITLDLEETYAEASRSDRGS